MHESHPKTKANDNRIETFNFYSIDSDMYECGRMMDFYLYYEAFTCVSLSLCVFRVAMMYGEYTPNANSGTRLTHTQYVISFVLFHLIK